MEKYIGNVCHPGPVTSMFRVMLATALLLGGSATFAQTFPEKPVRLIVPFGAGTVTDQTGRFLGQKMTEVLGQNVIVDNRPGANGIIGAEATAQAPADGYTLMIGTNTTQAANLVLYKKLPYDPRTDFTAVTHLVTGGIVLVVHPSLPVKSVRDLVAIAKQKPGQMSFGWANSVSLVGMEQLKSLAGVDITSVPYKTLPAALTDILGGRIEMTFGDSVTVMPFVRSGRLKALAISTPRRMAVFPDLPTVAEQGVPGYEIAGWLALFAPARTPAPIVSRINGVVGKILRAPEAVEFFGRNGWEPVPGTPEDLASFVRSEVDRWGRMIKAAGIQPE